MVHEGVPIDLCDDCGSTWASQDQLQLLAGGKVELKVLQGGKSPRRCASCRQPLRAARLGGKFDVEACPTCHGVFFEPGGLTRFKPPEEAFRPDPRAGKFECVKCGEHFPRSEGAARGSGLACRPCAGLADAPEPVLDPTDGLVDWLSRHRGAVLGLVAIVAALALFVAEVAWERFLLGLFKSPP